MPVHVAILRRPYLNLILAGRKTVESRLTRTMQPPHRCVAVGDRIFLKVSSGPWLATAVAATVDFHEGLAPGDVDELRVRYEPAVCGEDAYWAAKRDSRYATFITLADIQRIDVGPEYRKSLRAWHVIDHGLDPVHDVALTAGAIRNRYALGPPAPAIPAERRRNHQITLQLPDGDLVETGFCGRGARLRWRGWGRWYDAHDVRPGDRLRYVCVGPRRYRVAFLPADGRV